MLPQSYPLFFVLDLLLLDFAAYYSIVQLSSKNTIDLKFTNLNIMILSIKNSHSFGRAIRF